MRERKPTPKNAIDIGKELVSPYLSNLGKPVVEGHPLQNNRGINYSFKDDTVKDISIGLQDIDNAIMYYFNNFIKPTVIQDGNRIAVRTIYSSPERWKSVQADGFLRDSNNQIIIPIIMFKRENIEKNRTLGNKIDGNTAALYQVVGESYNHRNAYDKFSILNASDSYWGDPARFKFRASIDSFANTITVENGTDRAAKSTFNIKVSGYIIPDTVNKDLATVRSKFYTKSQVVFDLEVVDNANTTQGIDTMKFANKSPALNSSNATSFIGGGINVSNTTNILPAINNSDILYLNTNKLKTANTVTAPSTVVFTGAALLQPSAGSPLPPTSNDNFTFFINGINVASSLVTIVEAGGNVTLTFDTTSMGYTLQSTDEVIAIGKFQ